MNIGLGASALLAGGTGLALGVGTTLVNRPAEDRLGQSEGYVSGRELGSAVGAGSAAAAGVLGITSGWLAEFGHRAAALRTGGVAIGLGVAAIGTWWVLAATRTDPGVSFSSVALDLVDRYDQDNDGRLVGTTQPTITPGDESTRIDGNTYKSIDRLLVDIGKTGPDGRLTATAPDIAAVVRRYDANGDGRLQRIERNDFDAELGERTKQFD